MTEDFDDTLALPAALAAACSLSICEVLDGLAPRISARAETMRRAVEAAAQIGRAHGRGSVTMLPPCRRRR